MATHLDELIAQLAEIIRSGIESGNFDTADATGTVRAVFHSTGRFHDPCYSREWEQQDIEPSSTPWWTW